MHQNTSLSVIMGQAMGTKNYPGKAEREKIKNKSDILKACTGLLLFVASGVTPWLLLKIFLCSCIAWHTQNIKWWCANEENIVDRAFILILYMIEFNGYHGEQKKTTTNFAYKYNNTQSSRFMFGVGIEQKPLKWLVLLFFILFLFAYFHKLYVHDRSAYTCKRTHKSTTRCYLV